MIWQNLWAFAGLLALALPILIHLWSRQRALVQKFPSLRFLNVSRLLPTRSPRLSDIPLLFVRLAILAAAVLAFAQPLWMSTARKRALNNTIARAIIVDSSASMLRKAQGGERAFDVASKLSQSMSSEAQASTMIQTASPISALPGAIAWLNTQGSRGEIVIFSDFQRSAIDSASFATVPAQFGVPLVKQPFTAGDAQQASFSTTETDIQVTLDSTNTNAEWSVADAQKSENKSSDAQKLDAKPSDAPNSDSKTSLLLFSARGDQRDAELVRKAAYHVAAATPVDTSRPVAIVFPGATEWASLKASAESPHASWMTHTLLQLSESDPLSSASNGASNLSDTTITAPFIVVTRTASGAPTAFAAEANVDGHSRLLIFSRATATSVSSVALIAAVAQVIGKEFPISEAETSTLADATLALLRREPPIADQSTASSFRSDNINGQSDGRWLWALVVVLLTVESLMRRRSSATSATSET